MFFLRRSSRLHGTNQMKVKMRLENKVAPMTGGYGGMGRASGPTVRQGGRERRHRGPRSRARRGAGQGDYRCGRQSVLCGARGDRPEPVDAAVERIRVKAGRSPELGELLDRLLV